MTDRQSNVSDYKPETYADNKRQYDEAEQPLPLNNGDISTKVLRSLDNFDGEGLARWKLVSLAEGPECLSWSEAKGNPIAVRYFYAKQIELMNERTQEITPTVRVAFITTEGKAYYAVSDYVWEALQTMLKCVGRGPWIDGLSIKFVETTTRNRRKMLTIAPA